MTGGRDLIDNGSGESLAIARIAFTACARFVDCLVPVLVTTEAAVAPSLPVRLGPLSSYPPGIGSFL